MKNLSSPVPFITKNTYPECKHRRMSENGPKMARVQSSLWYPYNDAVASANRLNTTP